MTNAHDPDLLASRDWIASSGEKGWVINRRTGAAEFSDLRVSERPAILGVLDTQKLGKAS